MKSTVMMFTCKSNEIFIFQNNINTNFVSDLQYKSDLDILI